MPQRRLSASALYDAAFRLSDAHCGALTTKVKGYRNTEAHSPPLYYAVAAAWYDLGKFIGLSDPNAAYWVRS